MRTTARTRARYASYGATIGICVLLLIAVSVHGSIEPVSDDGRVIVRTDAGFEPTILTVPIGATVTFSTTREKPFWPASDVHPNHLVYREFDARRPVPPDETWSFTFDTPGSWRLHDHLDSAASGLVRVVAENDRPCDAGDPMCWDKILFERLKSNGVASALETLVRLHRDNTAFALNCHEYAHDLGLQTFHLYGQDFALTPKLSYCNAGFFHGYMEGFVGESFDLSAAQRFCTSVGEAIGGLYPEAEGQCRHGIGHGVMEYLFTADPSRWQEPRDMARPAVDACIEANKEPEMVRRCAAGAFGALRDWMISADSLSYHLEHRELFSLCSDIGNYEAKEACYWEFAKYLVRSVKGPTLAHQIRLEDILSTSDWDAFAPYVARSWGVGIGRRGVHQLEPDTLISFCRTLPSSTHAGCIAGLASGMIYAGDPATGGYRSLALCTSPEISADERTACFENMLDDLKVLPETAALHDACVSVPTPLQSVPPCDSALQPKRDPFFWFARPFAVSERIRDRVYENRAL